MATTQHTDETVSVDEQTLDQRDVRALTEFMTVLPDGGSMFTVIGENCNGEHIVDAKRNRCTCRDFEYRAGTEFTAEEGCKHIRRVRYSTGETAIPAYVDMDAVDDSLGDQLPNSQPRVAVTDGGAVKTDESSDEGTDTAAGERQRVPVAGGVLVFESRALGKELVGFEAVEDWDDLADALGARGLDRGHIFHLPELDAGGVDQSVVESTA
ncbi:hypothetical protein OSG_eHP14_00145 [environmental Halophage eHP-14]|nr:hypothetical protein OSG_eHP14_00145 [environmental Halophage eHP-14]